MASGPLRILLLHLCLPLLAFPVSCDDDVTLQSVKTWVQQQTATLQQQMAIMQQQTAIMQQQMASMQQPATMQQQTVSMQQQTATMQQQTATMQQQTAIMQQQAANFQSLQARLSDLETSNRNLSSALTFVNTRLNARAFFTAHMSLGTYNTGTSNSPIKFDTVVASDGGDSYNPETGVFTAPQSGVYLYYAQLMALGENSQTVHYAINKAGVALCSNSAGEGNNYDRSSCLVAAHVQKGETVFVSRISVGNLLQGGVWCSFSGLLVAADP